MSANRTWWDRVKTGLPQVAEGVVEVGAEKVLEGHGLGAVEATEIVSALTVAAKATVKSLRAAPTQNDQAVLRLIAAPDPSVTPCFVVFALPVRQHHVEDAVLAVAPRLWLSAQAAWIYAEHLACQDMGIKAPPKLILAEGSLPRPDHADESARSAWAEWCRRRQADLRPLGAAVPFGAYALAEQGGGVIAWRPVLTPSGLRLGVLAADQACSLETPPRVFASADAVREELAARHLPSPLDLFYLPRALATELQPNDQGVLIRARAVPPLWPGDPTPVRPVSRPHPTEPPVFLHPDWYVSRDRGGGAWAWRRVAPNEVSFARIRDRDGQWKTAHWASVSACLKHLGSLGQFGQEHPTLSVVPARVLEPSHPTLSGPVL